MTQVLASNSARLLTGFLPALAMVQCLLFQRKTLPMSASFMRLRCKTVEQMKALPVLVNITLQIFMSPM